MILPGFKGSTNARSIILDVAVRLAFDELEKRYSSTTLSGLASISSGGTPTKGSSASYGGNIPWAKISDVTAASKWIGATEETVTEQGLTQSSAKLFPTGTVLFSMYGSIGKTAITTKPMATNQAILGLIPKDGISAEYLYYCLISARTKLFLEAKGTSQKNINGGMVKSFIVPTPPLDIVQAVVSYLAAFEQGKNVNAIQGLPPFILEQRRIVGRLEHLASKIEEARGLRKETLGEVEAILAAEEMSIWPDEILEDAPTLEEITIHLARGKQSKQGKSDHHLVKTRHVQMGVYLPSDMTLVSEAAAKVRPEAVLQHGDVMIASSAAGCLGRVAYYTEDGRTTSTDTHISVARANRHRILPEYLYAYLKGAQGQVQLRSRERGDWQREKIGFRFTELNIGDLKKVPVPSPSIPEQHRIIEYLDHLQAKVDSLKQLQAQTRAELDALLPSILDRALRGEL